MNHHPRFPDIFFIFNPFFIESQNTYNNLDTIVKKIIDHTIPKEDYWEFSAECLKFNNFLIYFHRSLIRGILIKEERN